MGSEITWLSAMMMLFLVAVSEAQGMDYSYGSASSSKNSNNASSGRLDVSSFWVGFIALVASLGMLVQRQ